jgi:hypothetical protein
MPPLLNEDLDASDFTIGPYDDIDENDEALAIVNHLGVLDCIRLIVEDDDAAETHIELVHDTEKLTTESPVISEIMTASIGTKYTAPSVDTSCSITASEQRRIQEDKINEDDEQDSILETFLQYTGFGSEDSCAPLSCSSIVADVFGTTGIKPKTPKGILKKSTVKSVESNNVCAELKSTGNAKFPNRSQYIYNPEDDDIDTDFIENINGGNGISMSSETKAPGVSNDLSAPISLTRSVSFASVDVKEFKVTLGDHPNTASGPPVMLDPTQPPVKEISMDLNEFEQARQFTRRKGRRQLRMSYSDRKSILMDECGFTTKELNDAMSEGYKIRQQRSESMYRGNLLTTVDSFIESFNRKYQRALDVPVGDICVCTKGMQ